MTMAMTRTEVPVKVDEDKCIAHKGCTVCVDVCPLDVLAIDLTKGKAFMKFDECWYCLPCETDCPTDAIRVDENAASVASDNLRMPQVEDLERANPAPRVPAFDEARPAATLSAEDNAFLDGLERDAFRR